MPLPNPGATRNSCYYIWIPGMRQGASRQAWLSEASLHVVQHYLAPAKHGFKLCSLPAKHGKVNPASFPFCLNSTSPCLCCFWSIFQSTYIIYSMVLSPQYEPNILHAFPLSPISKNCCRPKELLSLRWWILASSISHTFDPPGLLSLAGFDTRLELGLCWHPPLLSPLSCSQQIHHGLAAH